MTDTLKRLRLKEQNGTATLEELSAADELEALRGCLIQFARIWAINEQLHPNPADGIAKYCAGLWPTMADARDAFDLVWKYREDGE